MVRFNRPLYCTVVVELERGGAVLQSPTFFQGPGTARGGDASPHYFTKVLVKRKAHSSDCLLAGGSFIMELHLLSKQFQCTCRPINLPPPSLSVFSCL